MALSLIINGTAYPFPVQFDKNWAASVDNWAIAVTNALLPISGGFLTLSPFPTNGIKFANSTNTGFLSLNINGSNQLTFNGVPIGATASLTNSHIFVGNVSNQPTDVPLSGDATIINTGLLTISNSAITDAKVSATAAIARTKLASGAFFNWVVNNGSGVLTDIPMVANRAVATDSNALPISSNTTATELGFVNGVTSPIQTQIDNITAQGFVPSGAGMDFYGTAAPSGWLLCDGSSYATSTYPSLFAAIGYIHGGSGPNFNVPNCTRRVGMGSGGSGTATIGNSVGNTGGTEAVTLTAAQIPSAIGTANSVVTDPGHLHQQVTATNGAGSGHLVPDAASATGIFHPANNTLSAATGISVATTITNSAGDNPHNNIQPAIIVLKIIKI